MSRYFFMLSLFLLFSCSEHAKIKKQKIVQKPEEQVVLSDTVPASKEEFKNETLFIYRKITEDCYHAIYIDKTKQFEGYKWLTDFRFDEYDSEAYNGYCSYLKEKNPAAFSKLNLKGIPKNWLRLYPYKGKHYLYAPSDWGNAGRKMINDSAFVYWYMDGPSPQPLKRVSQIGKRCFSIELASPEENPVNQKVNIYLLDEATQLYLFEFADEAINFRYQFYTPKESAKNFDLIVNYCNSQKQLEFDFEKVDYQAAFQKANLKPLK